MLPPTFLFLFVERYSVHVFFNLNTSNTKLTLTYKYINELISSRDKIVDKFRGDFVTEKTYETINRYYNLLLVEYYEFLESLAETEKNGLSPTLEELADIVLYQASLINELSKKVFTDTPNGKYILLEEFPIDREVIGEIPLPSLTDFKPDVSYVFSTYFMAIFSPLIKNYPDRKYHRGEPVEISEQQEEARTIQLFKTLEKATSDMVLFNLLILQNTEAEKGVELEDTFNRFNEILNFKIEKVDRRLTDEYQEVEDIHPAEEVESELVYYEDHEEVPEINPEPDIEDGVFTETEEPILDEVNSVGSFQLLDNRVTSETTFGTMKPQETKFSYIPAEGTTLTFDQFIEAFKHTLAISDYVVQTSPITEVDNYIYVVSWIG